MNILISALVIQLAIFNGLLGVNSANIDRRMRNYMDPEDSDEIYGPDDSGDYENDISVSPTNSIPTLDITTFYRKNENGFVGYTDWSNRYDNSRDNGMNERRPWNKAKHFNSKGQECRVPQITTKLCQQNFTAAYYYDPSEENSWERCKFFWNGGCDTQNSEFIFNSEHDCYRMCGDNNECNFKHSGKYCYNGQYEPNRWKLMYTFDPVKNRCTSMWFGNCSSFNVYPTLDACQRSCERYTTNRNNF